MPSLLRPVGLLLFFVLLFLLSVSLLLRPTVSSDPCYPVLASHSAILRTLFSIRRNPSLHHHPRHFVLLRSYASAFLHHRSVLPSCPLPALSARHRRLLHFSLFSYFPTDGFLLYLLAVQGVHRNALLEIDSVSYPALTSITPAIAQVYNASALLLHQHWSGFDRASTLFQHIPRFLPVHAPRPLHSAHRLLRAHLFLGALDVLALFPSPGDEISFLASLAETEAPLRPRIILVPFLDFWGLQHRSFTPSSPTPKPLVFDCNGRPRHLAGASLPALLRLAARAEYRLVACLSTHPIAFLVDALRITPHHITTLSPHHCLHAMRSPSWLRDNERLWDLAQSYPWQ